MSEPKIPLETDPIRSISEPRTLEYEQRPPGPRARRWLVRIAMFLAVVIAIEAGLYFWPGGANWVSRVRLRHAVMTHSLPAKSAVLTVSPGDSAATWSSSYRKQISFDPIWGQADGFLFPRPPSPGSQNTLFLHELLKPSGAARVVAIHLTTAWHLGGTIPQLDVRLFDPGSILYPRFHELRVGQTEGSYGRIPGFPGDCRPLGTIAWGSSFQLFGGQIDPQDPSKFTIGYTLDGKPGQLIGQLNDDDSISLRDASGAALPEHFPARAAKPGPTTLDD